MTGTGFGIVGFDMKTLAVSSKEDEIKRRMASDGYDFAAGAQAASPAGLL